MVLSLDVVHVVQVLYSELILLLLVLVSDYPIPSSTRAVLASIPALLLASIPAILLAPDLVIANLMDLVDLVDLVVTPTLKSLVLNPGTFI